MAIRLPWPPGSSRRKGGFGLIGGFKQVPAGLGRPMRDGHGPDRSAGSPIGAKTAKGQPATPARFKPQLTHQSAPTALGDTERCGD